MTINFKQAIFIQQIKIVFIGKINMKAIYSIQGNIGSGKSTFLNLLKIHVPQIQVIPQPVAEWQKISNRYNLLDQYYKDPNRWAFTFQINAVLSRMKSLRKLLDLMEVEKDKSKVFFSERSIVADKEIFARLLHEEKKMNDMEYNLYLTMYDSLNELFKTPKIHKFIYLYTSPQRCLERMKRRARYEESTISLEYLEKIHNIHQKWLRNQPNTLIIQGEEQFEKNQARAKEMIKGVRDFLKI